MGGRILLRLIGSAIQISAHSTADGLGRAVPTSVGAGMGREMLGQERQQPLEIDGLGAIASHFNGDGFGGVL